MWFRERLDRNPGLHSWVPDWCRSANAMRPTLFVNRTRFQTVYRSGSMDKVVVHGHGFSAAGESTPTCSFNKGLSELRVSAMLIDKIELTDDAYRRGVTLHGMLKSACTLVERVRQRATSPQMVMEEVKKAFTEIFLALKHGEVFENVMRQRLFFVTQQGMSHGIGPSGARSKDHIYIIAGCNFPMILRPGNGQDGSIGRERYGLVGEAYGKLPFSPNTFDTTS